MKKIAIIYLTLVMGIFTSCSLLQDPDLWMVEIEDAFRAEIVRSELMCISFFMPSEFQQDVQQIMDELDTMAEQIAEEHSGDSDVAKYKMALEKLILTDTEYSFLKDGYDKIDVNFGKFSPCPAESGYAVFRALERNTNIKVTFKINKSLDYLVVLDADDIQQYFAREVSHELLDMLY